MSTTCYGSQAEFDSVAYGSLAAILPMLERMGVREIINRHLPADVQAEFGDGEILNLLIAARMYSPVALSNVSEWARVSGADIATGIPAEKLNDDRLGRCLDHFFRQRHSILASIALHVSQTFDVPLREVHYDPTHILFTGAYADAAAHRGVVVEETAGEEAAILSDDLLEPAHITKGRAMDDVPKGAKMIHAGLCVQVDEYGPLPIFGHTIDGNQNGRHAVHEQFELMRKHLPLMSLTMISDRGTFSVGHLLRLKDGGCDAVCSVPWGEFQKLFDERFSELKWKPASYLSIEQQRRRQSGSELPLEEYQIAVLRQTLKDDPSGRSIACRIIFVHSTADQKVIRQQRQKQIDRITADLQKIQALVAAGRGKIDEASRAKRLARILDGVAAAKYFTHRMVPLTDDELKQFVPKRGCRPPTHRFEFTLDRAAQEADEEYDGYNAIVTTVPKTSGDELFTRFKQQCYSEQVNACFKGPLAVRPVFLHAPHRVESLVFLMMIALTLHYLIQRTYRSNLPADAPLRQRRTTTLTLMKAFQNYSLLIQANRYLRTVYPTRLTPRQREILQLLELPTPAQLLSRLLPRPPN